jgi:DNA mismatch repair protein MutS2
MNPAGLKALEFDRIVEAVQSFALTPLGRGRLADLTPLTDPRRVEAALAATTETAAYFGDNALFALRAPSNFETVLDGLAVEGRILEPLHLLGLADFLSSLDVVRNAVRRASGGPFPILRGLVESMSSFEREVGAVRAAIEPSGEIVDHASPELKNVRERLRKQQNRLRTTLESYLRSKETARHLQEQIVTDRNGRFVLLVKAENRTAIPGIVHGSSTSGATLFLEPLSTVEINNEVVALQERELDEIRRILLALSDAFRSRALDLQRTLQAATDLDALQARAQFARAIDGVAPPIALQTFELRDARHPLLIPAVAVILGELQERRRLTGPVPVDIVVRARDAASTTPADGAVLVITGPNTGGKTVALKTAGLLAMMFQAGLHIPVGGGSTLPVFQSIFADIGDEQSISASLSTFSWHMTNIARMDRELAVPALVLLDEIGAGTDPVEGGALGMALLDHFRRRGAFVIATTHYDMLKSYASTTEGVVSAAFGFDPATYSPTYRLVYGSAGRSLALEIASRLGLPAPVIDAARQFRSAREAQLADHLKQVDEELHALEHDRRLLRTQRESLSDREARLEQRDQVLREREAALRRRLDQRLDDALREARHEIDRIVQDLKRQAAAMAVDAAKASAASLSTGDTGAARAAARAALQQVADRFQVETHGVAPDDGRAPGGADAAPVATASQSPDQVRGAPLHVGDRVQVGSLGFEGIVRSLHDREAEVDVRGKRLRVRADDLRLVEGRPAPQPPRVNVTLQARDAVPLSDLNVIGCTADEARSRAEKFLDDASLTEQRTVRVIHGYGTGQLKRAIADLLSQHPLVERYGTAPPEQGGGGVTVVELKE